MKAWRVASAYGSGLVPVRDGMALEDYLNALSFKIYGVPPADKWVDELIARNAAATFDGLM